MKQPHLLFITTSSLAANPRLVKEFEALKKEFKCYVINFKHQDWTLELTETIKSRNPEVHFIEIDRKLDVIQTIYCKVLQKIAILLNNLFPKSFKICAWASNDKAAQLWFVVNNLRKTVRPSRVIAHNLGAFYPAVKLSEKQGVSLQLDIEDYYPGEALYFNKKHEQQNRMYIMAHSFLEANSITYASEGIKLECQKHFKVEKQTEEVTIINAFKATDFVAPKSVASNKIKCVWFSQHIGPNRGLEQVVEAAKKLDNVEFHLIGNNNQGFLDTAEIGENIILHDIMEQSKLHGFLAAMDIGLALEPGKDLNNIIALSNKIIAYTQSGLYVLATDTFGQSQFLNALKYNAGKIMTSTLAETLQQVDTTILSQNKKIERWQNAKSFSWENEQLKLKQLLK
ncbi:glycosyltransferase family protein [Winogradskyella schleiferi]|uniref:hypothetical protein n=1 Tax=Winogradskyella schleiferi TaxID=2686078 RepID=UPI0015BB27C8|nr:hypothetical protein [Winogradskyella schleiferi]